MAVRLFKFQVGDRVFDSVNQNIVTVIDTTGPYYTVRSGKYTPYEQQEHYLAKALPKQKRENRFAKLLNS